MVGAGEPFDRRVSVRVAQSTRVLVERSVARTCFAVSYLLRESILRGLDPAFEDLRYRIADARRQGLRHPPLAIFGRLSSRRPVPYGRRRIDPWSLLGDTPWSIGPRPVQLQTLVTRSLACAVTDCAVRLGVPDTVVVRHALALGWSVTCSEIELLLVAGYRPAYLFPSLTERLPVRRPRLPWNGPSASRSTVWSGCVSPGVDLSYIDPPLTEPDPRDPMLEEF